MCTVTGTFGPQAWILPSVEIEYPNGLDAYKWFAQFLLDGQIYPKLKKYRGSLLSQPSTMIKSWARLQPRTEVLLKVLAVKEVRSKSALTKAWEDNPKCKFTCIINIVLAIIIVCRFYLQICYRSICSGCPSRLIMMLPCFGHHCWTKGKI